MGFLAFNPGSTYATTMDKDLTVAYSSARAREHMTRQQSGSVGFVAQNRGGGGRGCFWGGLLLQGAV